MLVKWGLFILLDLAAAFIILASYLEIKGNYFSIILQKPVNSNWFGIVPDHPNPAPNLLVRIRGPFPLPGGLADYGVISVTGGVVLLRGQPNQSAYQSMAFYPNTQFRMGSAAPSTLDFKDLQLEEDGSYKISISQERGAEVKNWLDSQGEKGGMIALRTYRPASGTLIEYPTVELDGKVIQEKYERFF